MGSAAAAFCAEPGLSPWGTSRRRKLLPIEVVPGGLTFKSGRVVKELGDEGDMVRRPRGRRLPGSRHRRRFLATEALQQQQLEPRLTSVAAAFAPDLPPPPFDRRR